MRQPKPFYKKSHQAWYVNFQGRQVRLGGDEAEALKEYHRLMAADAPVTRKTTVVSLLDQFLLWTRDNRAERTYEWHLDHLNRFAKYVGPRLTIDALRPFHVSRWLRDCYKTSGSTHQNGACQSVSRAFNWARQQGLIAMNPVAAVEKPPRERREGYLSPENWDALIARIDGEPLADIFQFMRETGCRPYEARKSEARHWDRAGERLVLELALSKGRKGKKMTRIIRLNTGATAIIARLALRNPDGPLFLNRRGNAWTAQALVCRCADLQEELGFQLFPYILRHTWCTDALLRGVDPITVSLLMGHKDATMVMKVYNHLIHQNDFLKDKLRQATGEATSSGNGEAGKPPPASKSS